MYLEIPQGSKIDIQGLTCYIPPEGYVYNILTKQLEYRGVFERSQNKKEQFWERIPFPKWYKDVMKRWDAYDKVKKEDQPDFYDADLEVYKSQEWDRRLNGFWFRNNGDAVYLDGAHYMYLQWWQIDIGSPKYRITDLEYFYFLRYCIEDPNCMGMIEITKRRFGKTFRGGLFLYEYITRTRMTNGGIQSKTGQDAKKVFAKAVINPFIKLPKFFRPEYDMGGGLRPKSALVFQQTNVRGKKAESSIDKDELGSMIDHEDAALVAYDGQKIHRYFADEWSKTIEVNIYDRHEVIRYCLMDDEGNIIGKALYSSTVEKLETDKEGVTEAAKKLWDDSDHTSREENGRTASGLYRFFMTADRARHFDEYGVPNEERTVKEILADRATVAHNPRSLAARIRKEARTIEEAWMDDGEKCIFNILNINQRERELRENPVYKRRWIYYRDAETQKVKWRDANKNEFDFCWEMTPEGGLPEGEDNLFHYDGYLRKPSRVSKGAITVDSYSNSQGGRRYGSKASAWIGFKYDILNPEKTGKAVGHLYGRPKEKDELHNQVLLAAEYWGFEIWYEHTADDYDGFFKERGRLGYLGIYPLSTIEPSKRDGAERYRGFPITPFSLTVQNDAGISYMEHHSHKVDWQVLLDGQKKFDPYNRTKFDAVVSWLMLIVCLSEPARVQPNRKHPLVKVFKNEHYTEKISNFG